MDTSKVQVNARLPEVERRRLRMLAVQRGLNIEQALLQAVQAWIATAKPGELPRAAPPPRTPQQRPAAPGPRAKPVADAPATKSRPLAKPGAVSQVRPERSRSVRPPFGLTGADKSPRRAPGSSANLAKPAPSSRDSAAKPPSVSASGRGSSAKPLARGGAAPPPDLQAVLRQAEKLGLDTEAITAAWTGTKARNPRTAHPSDAADWSQRALALDWSQCPAAEMIHAKRGQVWVFRGTRRPLWDLFHNMQRGYPVDALMKHFHDLEDEQVAAVLQFAGQRMVVPDL